MTLAELTAKLERAESRLRVVSQLSAIAGQLDSEDVWTAMARVTVPAFADWCIVDLIHGDRLRRQRVGHGQDADPKIIRQLEQLDPNGYSLQPLETLGLESSIEVPISGMSAPVGRVTFVTTRESRRVFNADDEGFARDIAIRIGQIVENVELNERIQQSELRFRVALTNSRITVFEDDIDEQVRWMFNPQDGSPTDAYVGKRLRDFVDKENMALLVEARTRACKEAGRADVEVVTIDRRGMKRDLAISFQAIRGAQGKVLGTTGTSIDITETKRTQAQLGQALAFRDRMMGILGHDLRNPVSAVQAIAGLLMLDATLSSRAREGVRQIDQAAHRIAEMINTVLDFARTRFQGEIPISTKAVDLADVCRAVVSEVQAANPARMLTLDLDGDTKGAWDPARVSQAVSNLVANAVTHGDRATPVSISVRGEGELVELSVRNEAPNIGAERLQQLFEPFAQGEQSTGLGLGLYIARQIVRSHRGTIDVSSDKGVVTFTVRLPRS